jgi:hypothetical protein
MQTITKKQYHSLVHSIYLSLMSNPELDMADMGEAMGEADRIVNQWIEDNGIQNK